MSNKCITDGYEHKNGCQYESGHYCKDCNTFFPKQSQTYRRIWLLKDIWMVLHNLQNDEAIKMRDKIGIRIKHENYEELISEAEKIMEAYGVDSDSAGVAIKY